MGLKVLDRVFFIACLSASSAAFAFPAVQMRLVDAVSNEPIAGANVLFAEEAWQGTITGHGGDRKALFLVEAITDKDGQIRIPSQRLPLAGPWFLNTNYDTPFMLIFKHGYNSVVLRNAGFSPERKPNEWDYNAKTVTMQRRTDELDRGRDLWSALDIAHTYRMADRCAWRSIQQILISLQEEIDDWRRTSTPNPRDVFVPTGGGPIAELERASPVDWERIGCKQDFDKLVLEHFPALLLKRAVANNDPQGVLVALKAGADPNQSDLSWSSYLADEWDVVAALLTAPSLRIPPEDAGAVLTAAAAKRRSDVVVQLLDHGIPVDATNDNGWTAAMCAVEKGDEDLLDLLVRRGADVSRADARGTNILYRAIVPTYRPDLASKLVALGAPPTPMQSGKPAIASLVTSHPEVVLDLIKRNIGRTDKDQWGRTILTEAAQNGREELVHNLLDLQPPIFSEEERMEALIAACRGGRPNVVRFMLRQMGKVDKTAVRKLLGAGASSTETLKVIFESDAIPPLTPELLADALVEAARVPFSIEPARLLISRGAKPDLPSLDGELPLVAAARSRSKSLLAYLLSQHANPQGRDQQGLTALLVATDAGFHENPSIVENTAIFPKTSGAGFGGVMASQPPPSPQPLTREQRNLVLTYLIEPGVVEELLHSGADPNVAGKDGWTPLMRSVAAGCFVCAETLLAHHADRQRQNRSGNTALDIARAEQNQKMIELLTER